MDRLDREFLAVAAQGAQLDDLVQDRPFAGGQEMFHTALVRLAVTRRDDDVRHFFSERFRARPAEHLLGPRIPVNDAARGVNHDDGADGGVEDGPHARLALAQDQRLFLDAGEHLVEGVREQAQFVRAEFFGPDGIIPAVGNGPGGFGQSQDGQ